MSLGYQDSLDIDARKQKNLRQIELTSGILQGTNACIAVSVITVAASGRRVSSVTRTDVRAAQLCPVNSTVALKTKKSHKLINKFFFQETLSAKQKRSSDTLTTAPTSPQYYASGGFGNKRITA